MQWIYESPILKVTKKPAQSTEEFFSLNLCYDQIGHFNFSTNQSAQNQHNIKLR